MILRIDGSELKVQIRVHCPTLRIEPFGIIVRHGKVGEGRFEQLRIGGNASPLASRLQPTPPASGRGEQVCVVPPSKPFSAARASVPSMLSRKASGVAVGFTFASGAR